MKDISPTLYSLMPVVAVLLAAGLLITIVLGEIWHWPLLMIGIAVGLRVAVAIGR